MGLLNRVWSGLDFWDKQENANQRAQFARQDEEEERRRRQAQQQQRQQRQQQAQQQSNASTPGTTVQPQQSFAQRQFSNLDSSPLSFQQNQPQKSVQKEPEQNRFLDGALDYAKNKVLAPALSAGRVGTGIVQGAAGLYDQIVNRSLNPEEQNRVSKGSTKVAENIDQVAKELDVEGQYKAGNVIGEIATYFSPTAVTKIPKVANFATKTLPKVSAKVAGKGGKIGRFAGDLLEETLDPRTIEMGARLNSRYQGQRSARGEEVTRGDVYADMAFDTLGAFLPPVAKLGLRKFKNSADDVIDAGLRSVDNAPQTPASPGKVEIVTGTGVKVDAPEPVIRPQTPDMPPVRPDMPPDPVAPPTFGEIIQPEALSKAPVQQQLIPDVPIDVPPNRPLRVASEQVQQNIDELPTPEPAAISAEKPAPRVQAEAEAAAMPDVVPVDNSGRPLSEVEVPTEAAVAQKAAGPGEGAEVTVDKPVKAPLPAKPRKIPQSELPATSAEGLAKTGETGKSKGKLAKGQEYEKVGVKETETQASIDAANSSYDSILKTIDEDGVITARTAQAAKKVAERLPAGQEKNTLLSIANKSTTEAAQTMRMARTKLRRQASTKELKSKFETQLNQKSKGELSMGKKDYDTIDNVNESFVNKRDNYNKSLEDFNNNPSAANEDAVLKAHDDMVAADVKAKLEEYKITKRLAKDNKNPAVKDFVKLKEEEAGVYMMDAVDSSFLSSTRTMLNNYLNTSGVRLEETLFGKVGARLATRKTGIIMGGGGDRASRKLGAKIGVSNVKRDYGLRNSKDGNKYWNKYKNIVTTGNTSGERNIESAIFAQVSDHYEQALKKAGYTGDELKRRARVSAVSDPDNVRGGYENDILEANALSSITSGFRGKIESKMAEALSQALPDNKFSKSLAKAITRATIGFPTVIGRSLKQGAKRTTLGLPSYVSFRRAMAAGDQQAAAQAYKNFIKEAGSGAGMMAMGGGLAAAGLITGSYPSDPEERARWEREGIKENSIKVGDHYWQLPPLLGSLALPFMVGANIEQQGFRGEGNVAERAFDVSIASIKSALDTSPADSIIKNTDFLSDLTSGRDVSKYLAQTFSGVTRGLTPASSFLNQVGKMFDSTVNETNDGDFAEMFLDKVFNGVPKGQELANMLGHSLEDKEVKGQEIYNPNPVATLFGAVSKEQSAGVEKTGDIRQSIDDSVAKLDEYGGFSPGIRNLLDDEQKALFDDAKSGGKLDESDIKGLMDDIVKGVTGTSDTQFLEKEDYDNNLAVLKTKRDILSADPTITQASLEDYDTQITRGEIYKKNKTPYEVIKDYKDINLEWWRDMGDPDKEDYNQELYEQLWNLDQEMTEAGVGRGKKGKSKYYAKGSRSGSGSGSGRKAPSRSSSFRQLGVTASSPGTNANKYQAIDSPKRYIPDLNLDNKAKTNLKKSITVQKGVKYG